MIRLAMVAFGILWVSAATCPSAEAPAGVRALDKKLIEYGWDVPFADEVRANIRQMERRPFDGLIFKLRGGGKVLTPAPWTEAQFAKDYEALRQTQWQRFTDNFVIMWAASKQDWFSDEHWRAIENNVALMTRAARIGRCVGVCFDPEPYGPNPWDYRQAPHRSTKTFADYQAAARRRGAQFVRAIERELPKPKILTLFQLSQLSSLLKPMDPKDRAAKLSRLHYGLLPAFLNGMLDGAGPDVVIIDGNEGAYYYSDVLHYHGVYHRITQRALLLIDPALWAKYRAQVRVGQALYIDMYFGLRPRKVLGHFMGPESRAKWFEHNVYWALQTTDRYVWCYSERMNWWKDTNVPAGCEQAIRSARAKVAAGQPLGIDLAPIVQAARDLQRTETSLQVKRRVAEISRLPATLARPKIDGRLDDEAWKQTKPLLPFIALACQTRPLTAKTEAQITYDDQTLFVAIRCQEPAPSQMAVWGQRHDEEVWQGDDAEVLISVPGKVKPFYHFILNPKAVAWDAISDAAIEKYTPDWQRGAQIGKDYWTAEMAVPWSAMKMDKPKPGTKLRANLCRQRTQGGREWSSWSPMAGSFLEPDLFGTWVLR